LSPFKKRGFFYDVDEFNENVFTLNDIFKHETILMLKNSSLFNIKEINSLIHGKCYSFCPLTQMALGETINMFLKNKKNVEILMYMGGEDFWFIFSRFPLYVGSTKIESKNSDQIVSADLKVLMNSTHCF